MDEQVKRQAEGIRDDLISKGFKILPQPREGLWLEAEVPDMRGGWAIGLRLETQLSGLGDRLNSSLWRGGDKFYEYPLNPAAPPEETLPRLQRVLTLAVVNDSTASDADVERAVHLVREITPSNMYGFMGDKTPTAVLAEAVLRLMARVAELEARQP